MVSGPEGRLARRWSKNLVGAVYGEPLVVGSRVLVATERNQVYALDARTGKVAWRRSLGAPEPLAELPCGNIDPLGATGTPAYDARTGSLFVAAETRGGKHTLWSLDVTDGAPRWQRGLDTQADRNRRAEQQRAALLVVDGRVLTAFGGLAGDCDDYVGYVTSVPADGTGPTYSYAVPTAREAGIWATPGPVLGPNGLVYVAAGNGAELHGEWDLSDSVTALDPVRLRRSSVFAPSTWADDNAGDLDLGSSTPAMVPSLRRMVIAGKRGIAYLLPLRLGGVGSEIAGAEGCRAFGGPAVSGTTVLMPCYADGSVRRLHVGASSLRWGWTARGLNGSPVVAGRKVYVTDSDSGDLAVLGLRDGHELQRLHVGRLPHFGSQAVSGRWVFVGTLDGVVAFRG